MSAPASLGGNICCRVSEATCHTAAWLYKCSTVCMLLKAARFLCRQSAVLSSWICNKEMCPIPHMLWLHPVCLHESLPFYVDIRTLQKNLHLFVRQSPKTFFSWNFQEMSARIWKPAQTSTNAQQSPDLAFLPI